VIPACSVAFAHRSAALSCKPSEGHIGNNFFREAALRLSAARISKNLPNILRVASESTDRAGKAEILRIPGMLSDVLGTKVYPTQATD
jgi:hypothetical protein